MRPALPVARKPNWELENDQAASLKPVAESYITLQSLRQSREFWLAAFPKFSSRSRGSKTQDVVPPPHTIQTRGRCDLEIGPIIFPDTLFYEVHYLSVLPQPQPQQLPVLSLSAGYTTTPSSSSSATTQPYSSVYTPYSGYSATSPTSTPASTSASAAPQPAPLLSSLTSTTVTPALIHQVNSAASTNPTLANLLQLAASGKASPNQLKTLGLLIQSLAAANGTPYSTTTPAPLNPTPTPPVKEFDLVIEFPECPYDRFLFPREHVVCERMTDAAAPLSSYQDILIAAPIPFANSTTTTATTSSAVTPASHISTMRIKSAPAMLWDTVSRWVGGEETLASNRQFLSQIKTDRVYLAQRLAEGQLLTTLQTMSAPNFTMKPINPAAPGAIRPKRKYTPRKPKEKEKEPVPKVVPPSFLVLSPQPPPTAGTAPAPYPHQASYPTIPSSLSITSTPPAVPPSNEPGPSAPTPTPKKKAAKRNQPVHPRIACFSCDATNVPLIMGGRFCRPCVESGKANAEIPQPVRPIGATSSSASGSRAYHPYTAPAPTSTPSKGFTNAVPFGPPPPPPTS
ncbi:hypothetical protein AB1N83_002271 [Pleurotus pulmonarius]